MIVAIHQPHYLPWLRYMHKIASCDVFVLLDDAQYTKNGWQNRNKIKGSQGLVLLTVASAGITLLMQVWECPQVPPAIPISRLRSGPLQRGLAFQRGSRKLQHTAEWPGEDGVAYFA